MDKSKFYVEIDVDGVLADMDGSYAEYVKHIIPDFNEEKYIKDWGMPNVKETYPEAFSIIVGLYRNPDFIRNLPRYKGVEESLRSIYKEVEQRKGSIVIHTHILTPKCASAREEWLKELRRDTGVEFEIDICVGDKKKTRDNSLIVVEDNVKNLRNSQAPYKVLMRRGHNRFFTLEDIGDYEEGYIVKDLGLVPHIIKNAVDNKTTLLVR